MAAPAHADIGADTGDNLVYTDGTLVQDGGKVSVAKDDATLFSGPAVRQVAGETRELHVSGIARDGRPASGGVTIINVADGTRYGRLFPTDPAKPCGSEPGGNGGCVLLPPGTYTMIAFLRTAAPYQEIAPASRYQNLSIVGDPEFTLDRDATYAFDAREANEVVIDTPDHRTSGALAHLKWYRAPESGPGYAVEMNFRPGYLLEQRVFLQPMRQVSRGRFDLITHWQLTAPEIEIQGVRAQYYQPDAFSGVTEEFPRFDGRARLRVGRELALVQRSDGTPVATLANQAAAKGAKLVAIYNDKPGLNSDPGAYNIKLDVPTVWISREDAEKLKGRVEVRGESVSPYLYDLILANRGGIAEDQRHVIRDRDLAREVTRFAAPDRQTYGEVRAQFQPWDTASHAMIKPVPAVPRTRITYITPDPDTRWTVSVDAPERPYSNAWPRPQAQSMTLRANGFQTYRPGQRLTTTWFGGPFAAGIDPLRPVRRDGDVLSLAVRAFVDSEGHHGPAKSDAYEQGIRTGFRLYGGDKLIAETDQEPIGTLRLPPEQTAYRMEYTVDAPRFATRTSTVWTFTSQTGTGELSLPTIRYDGDARRVRLIPSTGEVTAEASYDQGKTYHPVRLSHADVAHLRGGPVTLRARATGPSGATITQEITLR